MPTFGSSRILPSLTPPLAENFGSFRHHFGKASLRGGSFGFFRRRFGSFRLRKAKREDRGEVGQEKGYRKRVGSRLPAPGSPGGESEEKERPISRKASEGCARQKLPAR